MTLLAYCGEALITAASPEVTEMLSKCKGMSVDELKEMIGSSEALAKKFRELDDK